MSLLGTVLEAAGKGVAPDAISRRLGVSRDLVETMIDHGARSGRLRLIDARSCGPTCEPSASLACASCPIRPLGSAPKT